VLSADVDHRSQLVFGKGNVHVLRGQDDGRRTRNSEPDSASI
jgi:hypothetical protein